MQFALLPKENKIVPCYPTNRQVLTEYFPTLLKKGENESMEALPHPAIKKITSQIIMVTGAFPEKNGQ